MNEYLDSTQLIIITAFLAIIARYVPFIIDFGLFGLTPVRIFMILTFLLAIPTIVSSPRVAISRTEAHLVILVILLILSGVWASHRFATISNVFDIIFPVLFFFSITTTEMDWQMLNHIWIGFTLFGVFLLAVFTISSVVSPYRDFSLFRVSYNQFARDVNTVLPIVLGTVLLHHRRYVRFLSVIIGVTLFATVILVQSRSGFVTSLLTVAFLAVIYIYWSKATGRNWQLRITAVVGFVMSITLGALASGVPVPDRLKRVPTSVQRLNPEVLGEYRYRSYDFALSTLADNWLFGIGYGSFKPAMEAAMGKGLIVHNFILSVWIGGGLFAVVAILLFFSSVSYSFLWFHYQSLQHGAQMRSFKILIIFTSFVTLIINGMVNPILLNPVLYLLAAFGVTMVKIREFNSKECSSFRQS